MARKQLFRGWPQASDSLSLATALLELKYFLLLSLLGLKQHDISRPLPEMSLMAKETKDIIVCSLMLSAKGIENGFHKRFLTLPMPSFLHNYLSS